MQMEAALVVKRPTHGQAREQDLAMMPSTGSAITFWDSSAAKEHVVLDKQQGEREAPKPSMPGAAALTKADLNNFVKETIAKERNVIAGAPGVPASARGEAVRLGGKVVNKHAADTALAHHPTWYDTPNCQGTAGTFTGNISS